MTQEKKKKIMKTFENRKKDCPARNFGRCLLLGKACLERHCVPWHFEKPVMPPVRDHEAEREAERLKRFEGIK